MRTLREPLALALASAATLVLELAWTRILSVSLWYHFGFVVLSTAMLGFGAAAVAWTWLPKRIELVRAFGLALPLAMLAGHLGFHAVPFEPFSLAVEPLQLLWGALALLFCALPFVAMGGLVVGLMSLAPARVHTFYLADLVAAGLGALLAVALSRWLGAPAAVLLAVALAAVAAAILWEGTRAWPRWGALALALLSAGMGFVAPERLPLRISRDKALDGTEVSELLGRDGVLLESVWNDLSRLDLIELRDGRGRPHRFVLFDGGTALTRIARAASPQAGAQELCEESFFLRRLEQPRVLVIGSGGGREIQLALRHGASHVDAVELNPTLNEWLRTSQAEFTGELVADPRVSLVTDEARGFLSRSDATWDVVHAPHTISNAALASGSLSLAENHLLTLEGIREQLAHTSPSGVLIITHPEAHMPRLFSTLAAAAAELGWGRLNDRVLAWRALRQDAAPSFYAGVAVSREPFDGPTIAGFARLLLRRGLEPLYLPGHAGDHGAYDALLRGERNLSFDFPVVLEPATDDKPYFNQRVELSELGWSDLKALLSSGSGSRAALEDRPVAEAALALVLVEATVLSVLLLLLPLWLRRAQHAPRSADSWAQLAAAAFGLGYMAIEIGWTQRLALYLASPSWSFATVLAILLVSSGLGSRLAERWGRLSSARASAAVCLVGLGTTLLGPAVLEASFASPLLLRLLTAVALLAPLGLLMGMPFPLLLTAIGKRGAASLPLAWATNSVFSVSGTILAVLAGMTVGFSRLLLAAASVYAVAAIFAFVSTRSSTASAHAR